MKQIKEQKSRKALYVHRLINIIKVSILPKVIYKSSIILINIPIIFFTELDKNVYGVTEATSRQSNLIRKNGGTGPNVTA